MNKIAVLSSLIFLLISSSSYGYGCDEKGSDRISDMAFIICAEGSGDTAGVAMSDATINARHEFYQICTKEYCDIENVKISPNRSECKQVDGVSYCMRYFEYDIEDEDYESNFKSCNELEIRNYDQEEFMVCGMGVKAQEGAALEEALASAKSQFFQLCQQKYCHIRNIDIYPEETYCHRANSNEVECTQYARIEVLDRQFDPSITDAHHVNEINMSFGVGLSSWDNLANTQDDSVTISGPHIRIAYSVSQYVSLGYHYFNLENDSDVTSPKIKQEGYGVDFQYYPKGYNQGLHIGAGSGIREYEIEASFTGSSSVLDEVKGEEKLSYLIMGYKKYFGKALLNAGIHIDLDEIDEFSGIQYFAMFGVGF